MIKIKTKKEYCVECEKTKSTKPCIVKDLFRSAEADCANVEGYNAGVKAATSAILEEVLPVIKFYADKDNWYSKGIFHKNKVVCPDMEDIGAYNCGGKRARQLLKELQELKHSIQN